MRPRRERRRIPAREPGRRASEGAFKATTWCWRRVSFTALLSSSSLRRCRFQQGRRRSDGPAQPPGLPRNAAGRSRSSIACPGAAAAPPTPVDCAPAGCSPPREPDDRFSFPASPCQGGPLRAVRAFSCPGASSLTQAQSGISGRPETLSGPRLPRPLRLVSRPARNPVLPGGLRFYGARRSVAMLSLSKNSFKIKQDFRGAELKSHKSSDMNDERNRNQHGLRCIPGEHIQEKAAHVRKSISSRDGEGYVPGTLYCTNLRLAFLPDASPSSEHGSCWPFLYNDHHVALSCISRLVAVNSFTKAKVLTSTSVLKFIPEELIVYCRDFRVLRFHFHDSGLEPQAFRVTMAIAQALENRDSCLENVTLKPHENSQLSSGEEELEEKFPTVLFETLSDWEKELKRLGTDGWRVSRVNERFDMSTSLPKYLWVPGQFVDNDLKRAFVHFNERRIPRLCWHHPGGSDLLRAANFHTDSDPEKEDMRSVETLMLAGHSQCVIVETMNDLPTPPEIQHSYSKLWSLSVCLADSSLAPSDEKWLSSLKSTRWLDHVRACLKKANEVAILLAERSRSVVLQESDDRDLNCLLSSLVQVISDPQMRTISGFQSLVQKEWVAAGHAFLSRLNLLQKNDRDESPVFLLFLDCIWQLLQQFPQSFEFTEAYLVAVHDSSYVPFSNTFLFNCQWERSRKNQNRFLNQLYTPINGWRENLCLEILQKEGCCSILEAEGTDLPTIWDWHTRYSPWQRAQFRNPCYHLSGHSSGENLNGNFLSSNSEKMENTPSGKGTLYLFSKGSLSLQTHFFPWKNGSLSKKVSRRAQLSEGPGEQDRSLRGKSSISFQPDGLLLLPSHTGPMVHLWKRCYLRGSIDFRVGLFAPSITGLMEELDLLQEQLSSRQEKEIYSAVLQRTKELHQESNKNTQSPLLPSCR